MTNKFLPNTFQHPNFLVDELMYLLTPQENVVLTFAVRRILGFQTNISSRTDNISLSQFEHGLISTTGKRLSYGCGLGHSAIRTALKSLHKYRILIKKPTLSKQDGQLFYLQDDTTKIDMVALEERYHKKKADGRARTETARCAVPQHKGVLSHSTQVCCPTATQNTQKHTETHLGVHSAHQNPETPLEPEYIDDPFEDSLKENTSRKRPRWTIPKTPLEKRLIKACKGNRKFWKKQEHSYKTKIISLERGMKPINFTKKQPTYPTEWVDNTLEWFENTNKKDDEYIPIKGFFTALDNSERKGRFVAEFLKQHKSKVPSPSDYAKGMEDSEYV